MQCLLDFYKDNTNYKRIIKYILYAKLLIEKGLIDNANKYIKKAKNSAYSYEEYDLLLNIIAMEESLCFNNCFITNYDKLKELQEEREKINKIIKNINDLLILKSELQQYQFNEESYNFDINKFFDIYGHKPLNIDDKNISIKAKSILFYIQYAYSFIQHDYNTTIQIMQKNYDLFKENPDFCSKEEYLQLMSNFLYLCCLTKNENLFHSLMKEFINFKYSNNDELAYITKKKYYRTLEFYHYTKRYNEAGQLAIEAEKYIEKNKLIFSNIEKIEFHFNIFRAYIDNNKYTDALRISQKQYKFIGFEIKSSIFKLFEFITHYKLGNNENLLYSIESWTKTIKSKRKQFPTEKLLIKFFRSVSNKVKLEDKKKLILNTIAQLKELEKSEQKYYINHVFDFTAWFERELEEMK